MYNDTPAHVAGLCLSAIGMTGNEITAAVAATAAAINAAVLLVRAAVKLYRAVRKLGHGGGSVDDVLDAAEDFAEEVQNIADSKPDQ